MAITGHRLARLFHLILFAALVSSEASAEGRPDLTQEEIEGEFLKANRWLKPNIIVVSCRGQELLDVRICFGRDLFPRSCGPNEQQRICRTGTVIVPATGSPLSLT